MAAVIELFASLFLLIVVGSIFYPFLLLLFLINRKITYTMFAKQYYKPEENQQTPLLDYPKTYR